MGGLNKNSRNELRSKEKQWKKEEDFINNKKLPHEAVSSTR